MSDVPSLGLRMGLVSVSLIVSLVAAEVVVRVATEGAFRQLPLFVDDDDVGLRLVGEGSASLRAPSGQVTTVTTDADGLRPTGASAASWLVVGDSQVLGLGVNDDQTFAALATAQGTPMRAVGVPGYGVADALRAAAAYRDEATLGVIVVVNQANDGHELNHPIETRFHAASGWLLPNDRDADWRSAFFASPLSHMHLLHHLVALTAPPSGDLAEPMWTVDVAATTGFSALITPFAAQSPVPVVVAFLPVDLAASPGRLHASPFSDSVGDATPWTDRTVVTSLRHALRDVPIIDLTPALSEANSFLPRDYHLSPHGHAQVASALIAGLRAPGIANRGRTEVPEVPDVTP